MGKVGLLDLNIFFHTVLSEKTIRTSEYVYLPQNSSRLCHISNFQWKRDVDVHFVVSHKTEMRERQRKRKRDRERKRKRDRERKRKRDRDKERERERGTNKQRVTKKTKGNKRLTFFTFF